MPEMQDTEKSARSIAADLNLPVRQVLAAIELLEAGNIFVKILKTFQKLKNLR